MINKASYFFMFSFGSKKILFRSTAGANFQKDILSFTREQRALSYHLIYEPWSKLTLFSKFKMHIDEQIWATGCQVSDTCTMDSTLGRVALRYYESSTVCPRSINPICMVTYCIIWVMASWTYCKIEFICIHN